MELLFMDPVFKEAIWGGTKLRDVFDYEIPSDTTGECWAISGHANGMSHEVGGQAVLGRQLGKPTPWLTERHGYDPTWGRSSSQSP